jgi:hypothetical protein
MSWPVTGSLVKISYGDLGVIAFGQAFKVDEKIDYQPVRVLGAVRPKTFVLSYITINGGFTVADHKDLELIRKCHLEVASSQASSAPSGKTFRLEATDSEDITNEDCPTLIVEDAKIINITEEVDISGKLLTATVTFTGRVLSYE